MNNYEIERKFLVEDRSFIKNLEGGLSMAQGYLLEKDGSTLRVRLTLNSATITFKGLRRGAVRVEHEAPLPVDMAELLLTLCENDVVAKMRYPQMASGHLWTIDVFQGKNAGLVLAEVELDSPDQEVVVPSWCGNEVTDDNRYYNEYMSRHPYCTW